jgi:hypothetical protein
VGRNSSLRLQFNGINYALETAIPSLQQVALQGANANVRLQLNGVGYATLAEIGSGGSGSVGTLAQVLAQGANTNGIDINLNNVGSIRTRLVGAANEIQVGNGARLNLTSFDTVALNGTFITGNSQTSNFITNELFSASAGTAQFSLQRIAGTSNTLATISAESIRLLSPTNVAGSVILESFLIRNVAQTVQFTAKTLGIGIRDGSLDYLNFNFHPATFTNGQKYVFQFNSATNTMNLVPA